MNQHIPRGTIFLLSADKARATTTSGNQNTKTFGPAKPVRRFVSQGKPVPGSFHTATGMTQRGSALSALSTTASTKATPFSPS